MALFKKKMINIIDSIFNRVYNKIMFVHVPKCGGTSISNAVLKKYGFWRRLRGKGLTGVNYAASKEGAEFLAIPLQEYRRKILVYHLCNKNNYYVSGHVSVNNEILNEFYDEWNFVTVIRDPVERWYSEYFYNRYKNIDHFKTDLELEDYLNSKKGRDSASSYVSYFAGMNSSENKAIEQAKKNLSKFSVVGLLEDLSQFKNEISDKLNFKLDIPHKNESPAPRHIREDVPSSIHEKVVELCEPDRKIYQWVKNNIVDRSAV
jgi:hypothetical protein